MQVQLPKTDFPMKGNLSTTEPARIDSWLKTSLYQKIMQKPAPKGIFCMPDGPPYANGNIHVGHVLNKVLKDIVVKYKNLAGYRATFIPGWDCHGLPIELNVTKKLGPKRKEHADAEVREMCREEARTWIAKQKAQFQRLGVVADWENPYLTLDPAYEADEIRVLAKINDNGIFYRGEKPVYWDPALQTALAAAEVEYKNVKSLSIFVRFPMKDKVPGLATSKPVSMVIWTTTPWTLPANFAIALNKDFSYGFYEAGDQVLIMAEDLMESVGKECGLNLVKIGSTSGSSLEGLKASHPFMGRDSVIILGDHVTLEAGSGAVHTAPGHGLEDYAVGLKYNLPVYSGVDEAGRMKPEVPHWMGLKLSEANPKIVEWLKENGFLLSVKEIEHSYPHSPRSKAPVIFRATPQWFIRMDDDKYPLRQKCLNAAEKQIQYFPKWGAQRLISMISNSPDWCLSRQRVWGVPVPVWYCEKCNEPLIDSDCMNRLADAMEKSGRGIEAYHAQPAKDFTSGKKCKCGHTEFKTGKDILDVWFDSGIEHTAVQKRRKDMAFPADIYLEGSDQHRGWFQTSLVSAMASEDKAPFKALVTHGFVMDAQGYKMSKSQGNTVDPEEIIKESGAEILRIWVSHEDYGQDLTISKEMMGRISDTYRRFRNTIRFLLGNLNDFDPAKDQVAYKDMTPLDHWALNQLHTLISKTTAAYDAYEFYKVYHALNTFFAIDLSATYLDILKDRLYTGKVNGVKRRAAQTVLYQTVTALCGVMAPIASFLAEETYGYLPGEKKESVFLTDYPVAPKEWANAKIEADFATLLEVRAASQKVMEDLRREKIIGSSLDAQLSITAPAATVKTLEAYRASLREFLMVSQFEVKEGKELQVQAGKASGEKCERCWHYDTLGTNKEMPTLCPKCVEALT